MRKTHDYIHTYHGYWTPGGRCRVEIYEEDARPPVVVCSELADNDNTSVTNLAEYIAAEVIRARFPVLFDTPGEPLIWIEHYPPEPWERGGEGLYSRVTFASYTPVEAWSYSGRRRVKIGRPTWTPITPAAFWALLGAPTGEHRVYVAERGPNGEALIYVENGGQRRPLRHVAYHSPTGFEWGYGGSGPADTALSILADYFGEQPTAAQLCRGEPRCWTLHQAFKWTFLAPAPYEGFRLPGEHIADWLHHQSGRDTATG